MEFYIKKNATLPVLKMQVVKDGRSDYNKMMEMIEEASIFFSMVDTETGIPRIVTRPAGFVEKTQMDPNAEYEYYVYYQFTPNDTRKVGRYEGQFLLRNSDGTLILPIREKLYINVQESFIADDLPYESCYVVGFPCCASIPTTTTTTTTPCPSCRACCPTPTPVITTTTTIPVITTTTTIPVITTTTTNAPCSITELPQPGDSKEYSNGLVVSATATGDWLYKYCNLQDTPPPSPCHPHCLEGYDISNKKMFWPAPSFGNTTVYTLNFSYPVNDIALIIWIYTYDTINGVYYRETFTFTTDTGTNIPTITSFDFCCANISGNTLITQDNGDCWSQIGSGVFYFNNDEPFTQLIITTPNWGNETGIMPPVNNVTGFLFCEESFGPTTTTTTTISLVNTIYLSLTTKNC